MKTKGAIMILRLFLNILYFMFVLICVLRGGTLSANSGYLVVISETGITHNACMFDYGAGKRKWIGFRPVKRQPIGPGMIDETNRENLIETYVRFAVDIDRLKTAENNARQKYNNAEYILGVRDCVNLAEDVVRDCGYKTRKNGNTLPAEFVKSLVRLNQVENNDSRPFPWVVHNVVNDEKVKISLKKIECLKTETIFGADKIYLKFYSSYGKVGSPQSRKYLNNNQVWALRLPIQEVNRGHSVAIQLWDDDSADKDDLVFDWSISTAKNGLFTKTQVRGTPAVGSESKYRVTVSVDSVE